MALLNERTQDEQAKLLGQYFINGPLGRAKVITESNLYKLFLGLAAELNRLDQKINEICSEHEVANTTLLIEEWESAVGIPDDCFFIKGKSLQERINQVIIKLSASVQTAKDFVDILTLFGITATVEAGSVYGRFPMKFPIILGDDRTIGHIIVITIQGTPIGEGFPYTFPITFGEASLDVVKCFLDKIKPANVEIQYR